MQHVVIIGNGIAGVTAARHIRKHSDASITIISNETEYFFSRTALMYVFMGHLKLEHTQPYEKEFWKKNKIALQKGFVTAVDTPNKSLVLQNGTAIAYDTLIIATGSKPNKFGWPGEDAKGVLGLYHKQDLEELEQLAPNHTVCKRAVIVGGGLIGIELAEMFYSRNIPVTFLVREASFWNGVLPQEESGIVNTEILEHHIDLRLGATLKEIKTDANNKVTAVVIKETEEEIPCSVVGLTAGVSPNIAFLEDATIATAKGVLVNQYLETNIPDIYAIGDCAEQTEVLAKRRPIEAVWYTGRMMGETVAQTICGNRTKYQPGPWFNSAKFFNIEYQTYGWIPPQAQENENRFYWKHNDGKKCIHINYDKNTEEFLGINTLGIRLRHAFFDRVLREKKTISYVLQNLRNANFDPEFYKTFEREILQKYNAENNTKIPLKKKSWKQIFNSNFL